MVLIVNKPRLFADNWIYVHDPGVKVGRIQNFGNWSADLVQRPGHSCLGLKNDTWAVNTDCEYHEEAGAPAGRRRSKAALQGAPI